MATAENSVLGAALAQGSDGRGADDFGVAGQQLFQVASGGIFVGDQALKRAIAASFTSSDESSKPRRAYSAA